MDVLYLKCPKDGSLTRIGRLQDRPDAERMWYGNTFQCRHCRGEFVASADNTVRGPDLMPPVDEDEE